MSRPPERSPNGRGTDGPTRSTAANPLLEAFHAAAALGPDTDERRTAAISTYGFAIPCEEALDAIERWSPDGVVEIGAGTGYWAGLLHRRGVDVVAFDIEPAPSPRNAWFAGTQPWHPVHPGDHDRVREYPGRTLLLVWPTNNEIWAAAALEAYREAGGRCVVFVGEGPGGRTGDAVFHAMLGELTSCLQCGYRAMREPCICGVEARWRRTETVALPQWPGFADALRVYVRAESGDGGDRRRRSGRWRAGQRRRPRRPPVE
jgi:hypothetical protein